MSNIDVIVPCYRYGEFLQQCVESTLAQTGPAVRVLIIDDASPDNTAEIAAELRKRDARVTFVRHPRNKGHIESYNEGIDWASAEYLLLLSADDYLLPGALSRAVSLMDRNPEIGFTFGKAIDLCKGESLTDTMANRAVTKVVSTQESAALDSVRFCELLESMHSLNIVRTPTAIVRTTLQKCVGGYRKDLPHAGDLEMWLRLAAHASVGVIAAYQAVYRLHGNNMQVAYYARYLPDLEQRKAALSCIVECCGSLVPNSRVLHQRLLRQLAEEAVVQANNAFTAGDVALTASLCTFAVNTYPGIRITMPWFKIACKRLIGSTLWGAVRPALLPLYTAIRTKPRTNERLP